MAVGLTACSSRNPFPSSNFESHAVVKAGLPTTMPLGEGGTVTLPPGAAPVGASLSVESVNPPSGWDTDHEALRAPVHLALSSGSLQAPATLSFPYDPSVIPAGMSPTDAFGISTYDPSLGEWVDVPVTADQTNHLIVATVSHFSWWNPVSWTGARLEPE